VSQVACLAMFSAFVLGAAMVRFSRDDRDRRRRVMIVVLFTLGVYALLAATARDAWPFSTHGMFSHRADPRLLLGNPRFAAVDLRGREWDIDPESWSPASDRTVQQWFLAYFHRLDAAGQRQVLNFLLDKAEDARRRARRPGRIGHHALLGPLAAPRWYAPQTGFGFSDAPYQRIRVYIVSRLPGEKLRAGRESSQLVAEFAR
jgi:hypothetical protein